MLSVRALIGCVHGTLICFDDPNFEDICRVRYLHMLSLVFPVQKSENPEETCYLAPDVDDDEEFAASQVF